MGYLDIPILPVPSPTNLATSGVGGITGTLPFANMQPKQVIIGLASSTISAAATSGSYIPFTQGPTISFTPLVTGSYLLFTNVMAGASNGITSVKISTSAASVVPTVLFEHESNDILNATSASMTCVSVYNLTANQNYAFQMFGKNSLANGVILHNQIATSGTNITAFQLS